MLQKKLKSIDEITTLAAELHHQNKRVVTTNGSFDILHWAHANLLQKAKQEGDVLIVLLNSDSSIKANKADLRPIITEHERALMLASLQVVDYVVIFSEDNPLALLERIKPTVHVKGGSFIPERIQLEQALLAQWHGRFKHFELDDGFSTSNIIKTILERHH